MSHYLTDKAAASTAPFSVRETAVALFFTCAGLKAVAISDLLECIFRTQRGESVVLWHLDKLNTAHSLCGTPPTFLHFLRDSPAKTGRYLADIISDEYMDTLITYIEDGKVSKWVIL